jgi:hypothetical protein
VPDDDGLDDLLGDEPDQPDPIRPPATEYAVGRRANRRVIAIVAAVVVLIVAAGVIIGITVSHHQKNAAADNIVNSLPAPAPTITVTVTATPSASASASVTPSATASPTGTALPNGLSSYSQASQIKTFYAYYAAINDKDWQRVWSLGGKNLDTSYDAMIAGYAKTAKDVPYLVGLDGDELTLKLLAFKTNGRAQLFSGTLTIEGGEIVSGQQTLSYADSNDSFGALAGDWYGHDRDLEITPGGLGVATYRTFKNCAQPADGCDQIAGSDIVDGGTIMFQLNGGQANAATGDVTFSTVGSPSTVTLAQNSTGNAVSLSLLPKFFFCNGKPYLNECGA